MTAPDWGEKARETHIRYEGCLAYSNGLVCWTCNKWIPALAAAYEQGRNEHCECCEETGEAARAEGFRRGVEMARAAQPAREEKK